jgi:hypothetical protein
MIQQADNKSCENNNHSLSFNNGFSQEGFCYYAGLLLFAPYLSRLKAHGLEHIRQWVVTVLLGLHNVEQAKTLCFSSLDLIIGDSIRNLHVQRQELKALATPQNLDKILSFNASIVGINEHTDFYFDPHGKQYTGALKILKGWCAKVRMADKVLYTDMVHTVDGFPVYLNSIDNYDDLRERYPATVEAFREKTGIDAQKTITMVIDRGIFSRDIFKWALAQPRQHIITWEKGYKNDGWDKDAPIKNGSLFKARNHKHDLMRYHYQYIDTVWHNNKSIRKLVVRITNPKLKTAEVSILTDDMDREAREIITLMFSRWIQENDFKYLIKHFGIDQITSYEYKDYKSLQDKIKDKRAETGEHKSLKRKEKNEREKLKTQLLRKHRFHKSHGTEPEQWTTAQASRLETILDRIQQVSEEIEGISGQLEHTRKEESKLQHLIDEGYVQLKTDAKTLMDAIKLLARNIFYLSFRPFKEKYDNYRDDHVLFRHLSRSNGMVTADRERFKVELMPKMNCPPKLQKIFGEILEEINENHQITMDGSDRELTLDLTTEVKSFFAFSK